MPDEEPVVTVLTEYFHPEEATTAKLMTGLTTGLTDRFAVNVITALPSYHEDDRQALVSKTECYEGVFIRRLRSTRFDKDSLPLRVVNWLSFTLLVVVQLLFFRRDDDVRVALSNPPILPFATWFAKRFQGVPYVYVLYDMYPEMPIQLGYLDENGLVARGWKRTMKLIYRDADRIVVLGESMERKLDEKLGDDPAFDSEKVVTIQNWEDPEFIQPMEKSENEFAHEEGTTERFTLLYSGNIGRFHELRTAVDAIAELESRGRTDIQFLVIGQGGQKDDLQAYVDSVGVENVRFLPFQPMERLPETLTCADASLVGIKPEMEGLCVSSKLYSSLAAGMPVLAVVGEHDEVARVVLEHDCGEWVPAGDTERAADVLAAWADNPELASQLGGNARCCLEDRYSRDRAVDDYADLLATVARR